MNTKRLITRALFVIVLTLLFLGGCNTWKGMGKDIERTGENIQDD
jgi:predicted small secreted protein